MRFLNGLFWFLLAVVVSIFTYGNWKHVEINLWSGLIADVNLPLLLLIFFLAGFVPMVLWHQAVKWRMKQRLAAAERSLAAFAAPSLVVEQLAATDDPLPAAPIGDLVERAQERPAPRPAGA